MSISYLVRQSSKTGSCFCQLRRSLSITVLSVRLTMQTTTKAKAVFITTLVQ